MDESEFDKFAEEYTQMHRQSVGISGEEPAFFAEYKVKDTAKLIRAHGYSRDIRIMDFGSGIGESTGYFSKYLEDFSLVSLDVSRKSLEIAQQRFGEKSHYVYFDGSDIPFGDSSFEVIFTACVFHHIPTEFRAPLLSEIRRVLKPGGMFIAFEHNPYNFLTVRAVDSCPFDENAILIKGKEFSKLLQKAGFVNVKLAYRIFFPNVFMALRALEKLMTRIPFGGQYYVAAEKIQ